MPKYCYKCKSCEETYYISHGMNDVHDRCVNCGLESLNRVPQMPHIKREISSEGGRVGSEVKRAIDENRALLDEERKKRVEYKDGN
jgi:predicted nuclease with TOPRIM domain